MNSVYHEPECAQVREDLHQRLTELRAEYGDSDANDERFLKAYLEVVETQ